MVHIVRAVRRETLALLLWEARPRRRKQRPREAETLALLPPRQGARAQALAVPESAFGKD